MVKWQTVFVSAMIGTDRYMPGYLVEMMKEYTRAWECGWNRTLRICLKSGQSVLFLLNPDGYEIMRMISLPYVKIPSLSADVVWEVSCKEFTGNAREQNSEKFSLPVITEESRSTSSLQVKMKQKKRW